MDERRGSAMNIALIAHDNKKELMAQFCTAYAAVLSQHSICATGVTGSYVAERSRLPIHLFMSGGQGGNEQIGVRLALNEIDLVLYFNDPSHAGYSENISYITGLCDKSNIPIATNAASAEVLVMALSRGDLDWREIVNPKTRAAH